MYTHKSKAFSWLRLLGHQHTPQEIHFTINYQSFSTMPWHASANIIISLHKGSNILEGSYSKTTRVLHMSHHTSTKLTHTLITHNTTVEQPWCSSLGHWLINQNRNQMTGYQSVTKLVPIRHHEEVWLGFCLFSPMHTHIRTRMHTHVHTHTHARTHTHIYTIHITMHALCIYHTHTHTHTPTYIPHLYFTLCKIQNEASNKHNPIVDPRVSGRRNV